MSNEDKRFNESYVTAMLVGGNNELMLEELSGNPVVSVVVVHLTGDVDENGEVTNVNREVAYEVGVLKDSARTTLSVHVSKDKKNVFGVEYRDLSGNKAGVYLSEPTLADGTSNIRMEDLSKSWFTAPYDLVYTKGNLAIKGQNYILETTGVKLVDDTEKVYKELIINA